VLEEIVVDASEAALPGTTAVMLGGVLDLEVFDCLPFVSNMPYVKIQSGCRILSALITCAENHHSDAPLWR